MKTLPSIIAATLLIATANASAGFNLKDVNSHTTIETSAASSKAAAYENGVNKLSQLKSISPRQLDIALGNAGDVLIDTLHLQDGSNVTIEERVSANGQKSFVGLVKVAFGYTEKDTDK